MHRHLLRSLRDAVLLLLALMALVAPAAGCADRTAEDAPRAGGTLTADVVRVVDGDTIVVRLPSGGEERVRYIGIDAPEVPRDGDSGEPLYAEATAGNQELLAGGIVRLEFDRDLRDDFGRLLAYAFADQVLVNEVLVRQGLADARSYPPNTTRDADLSAAEREARAAGRGIWGTAEE